MQQRVGVLAFVCIAFVSAIFLFHGSPVLERANDLQSICYGRLQDDKEDYGVCDKETRLQRVRRWCQIEATRSGKRHLKPQELKLADLKKVIGKIMVDENHKVLYCAIAKSGSTTWKHILANNTGHYQETASQSVHGHKHMAKLYNITQLTSYSHEKILYMLKHYFTFIVVRNPFDRLVSGYKDKLAGNNRYFQKGLGSRILGQLRPNISEEDRKLGRGVTFQEYTEYFKRNRMNDQHFATIQSQCSPCVIDYDYIAKLETQHVDAPFIINNRLSGFGAESLTNKHSWRGGASNKKPLPEFEDLSKEDIYELMHVYDEDFNMFGYSSITSNGTSYAVCKTPVNEGYCC